MCVTILDKPDYIDFSGNGLKYKVKGENAIVKQAEKCRFYFIKVGTLAYLDSFWLPIPNDSVNGIHIFAGYDYINWNYILCNVSIEKTVEDFKRIHIVNKYYNVWNTGDRLYFEYKKPGVLYTTWISAGSKGYVDVWDCGSSLIEVRSSNLHMTENYYINAFVSYRGKNVELMPEVDINGETELDIGKFLHRDFIDKGPIQTNYYEINEDFLLTVKFGEHYDSSDWHLITEEIQALPGKIAFNKYPDYDFKSGALFNTLQRVESHKEAFHKLTYYRDAGPQVCAKFHYTDNTSEYVIIFEGTSLLFCFDFIINEFLSLHSDNKKKVYKFNVYPSGNEDDKIEIYIQDKSIYSGQFLIKNSFGFWETIDTESHDSHVIENAYTSFGVKMGSKNTDKIEQIAHALRSKEFYEIDSDKKEYKKCELISDPHETYNDKIGLQYINFKYKYIFDD